MAMRVILWVALVLTTVVTVSGHKSLWPWPRVVGMQNPRCISCTDVKEAHLCENCCKESVCDPDPCKNDGVCSPVDNGYSCSCSPGYLGEHCDVNVCLPNPCKNDGICSPVDNGYSCNCATGYLGQHCDVNPCDVYNPCLNNGTCYPSEFVVNCSCPLGFIGTYCEVNPCDVNNPCLNNGRCYPSEFVVKCSCPLGFIGEFCQDDLCDPSPCNEGRTCFRVDGGFDCRCIIVNDGNITSPNYPRDYPNQFDKCYLISGRPGQNTTLTLEAQYFIEVDGGCDFQQYTGEDCDDDYLVLDGVRYCGAEPPDSIIVPTGENTTVRFRSGPGITCTGFNLSITYTDV